MLKIAVDNGLLCLDDPLLYLQPEDDGLLYDDLELTLKSQAHATDATVVFNVPRGAYYLFSVATEMELIEKMDLAQSVLSRGGRSVLLAHHGVQGPPRKDHVCHRMSRPFSWASLTTETEPVPPKTDKLTLSLAVTSLVISLAALVVTIFSAV